MPKELPPPGEGYRLLNHRGDRWLLPTDEVFCGKKADGTDLWHQTSAGNVPIRRGFVYRRKVEDEIPADA